MTRTGPQRYPGASTAYWYQSAWGGDSMESNVIVWHTTEGTSLPSYSGGAQAPNFTAVPDFKNKRLVWHQHFDFDTSSRALVNKAGGVETNTLNVCQVEIVGTCDPSTHKKWGSTQHLYTPDLPDWVIRDLAAFAKWAHDQHGVPLSSSVTFKAYPGSYGSNGVRMTAAKWNDYRGHCGHQHVPENDHGDPGLFPMGAVLDRAKGNAPAPTKPPQQEESAVPSTLGLYSTTDRSLAPGKWTTLTIDKTDIVTGAKAYTTSVMLTIDGAPAGGTLQGRFYHQRPDGSRWDSGIVERITTAGSTFADFPHAGSIAATEKLRFEVAYFPATSGDAKAITITTSRVRGLYWK
ncbi:hypothetical protein [Streptomyces malaysiensis]|uniref:hypothetical protein n=1 Tax=Streptomyces malaysiensis TaxID=92644 RepID=UPI0036973D09